MVEKCRIDVYILRPVVSSSQSTFDMYIIFLSEIQVNQFACEHCRADRDFEQEEFQSIEDSVRRVREQVRGGS